MAKKIETFKDATVLDTVTGMAFEIDYAHEKNGEIYYHCGGKDGFDLKDNSEFTVLEKDSVFKNGRIEQWLKIGDNNRVVEAIASKIYSVDNNQSERFSLSQVYNESYKNAEGVTVPLTINERYSAFQKDLSDLNTKLKNTYGEKGLAKKDCVEARMLGISRLMQKYDIGRDIMVYRNYKELGVYDAAVDKTNADMKDKQSMSAIARQELKVETIKAEMEKYEKSHHIGKGFKQLALGTILMGVPLINVYYIGAGLKNIFFKSYANKIEKDYYKELKAELKTAEKQMEAVVAQQAEINKIENNINKIDKEIDRQEQRLAETKEKLKNPSLTEKEKTKLQEKTVKIARDIDKQKDKREAQEEKLKALGVNPAKRIENSKESIEESKNSDEKDSEENKNLDKAEKDSDNDEKKSDGDDKKSEDEKKSDEKKSDEKASDNKEEKQDDVNKKAEGSNEGKNENPEEPKKDAEIPTEPKPEEVKPEEAKPIDANPNEQLEDVNSNNADKNSNGEANQENGEEKEFSKDELKAEITDLNEKINELERLKANKNNKLEYAKSDLAKVTDETEKTKLEHKITNIQGDIDKADVQLTELKSQLVAYESKLSELEKVEQTDGEAKDDKDIEIEKLKFENTALQKENADLKTDMQTMKTELDSLKNEINDLKEKIGNVENNKDNTENKELIEKNANLEKENQDLKSEINSKDDKITELEAKIKELENKDNSEKEELSPENFEEPEEAITEGDGEVKAEDDVDSNLEEIVTEKQKIDLKVATAEHREEAFARRIGDASIDSRGNETIIVKGIENGKMTFDIISKNPTEANEYPIKSIEISSSSSTRPDKLDTISSNGIELTFSKDIINNRIGYKENDSIKDMIGKGITSKEDNQLLEVRVSNPDGSIEIYNDKNSELPTEVKNEIKDLIGTDAYDKVADKFEENTDNSEIKQDDLDKSVEEKSDENAEEENTEDKSSKEEDEKTSDDLNNETYDSNEIEEDKTDSELPNADFVVIEENIGENNFEENNPDDTESDSESFYEADDDYDYDSDDAE